MEQNTQKMSEVLVKLIDLAKRGKIDQSKEAELTSILMEIVKIEKENMKTIFGSKYEDIDFSYYNENDGNNGYFISNIRNNKNGNIEKRNTKPVIKENLFYNYSTDKLMSDKPVNRIKTCMKMVNTILHEFRHYYQDLSSQNTAYNIESVQYAIQNIMDLINYQDLYQANYFVLNNEVDARVTADDRMKEIISKVQDDEERELLEQIYSYSGIGIEGDVLNKSTALYREGKSGNFQDKENLTNQILLEYIKKNPSVLNIYKSLLVEYNADGSKKDAVQLINELRQKLSANGKDNSITDEEKVNNRDRMKKMYFELIGNELSNMTLEQAKELESRFGKDGKGGILALYSQMKEYYTTEYDRQFEQLEQLQEIRIRDYKDRKDFEGYKDKIEQDINYRKEMLLSKYQRRITRLNEFSNGKNIKHHEVVNGVDIGLIKPKNLSEEKSQIRYSSARKMIDTYEKIEDEEQFSIREKDESRYFKEVLNAIKLQRCSSGFMKTFKLDDNKAFTEHQIQTFMRILKAADNLTIDGGEDFLEKLCSVPFINDTLLLMRKAESYKKMEQNADKVSQKLGKETQAEKDKNTANEYLKSGKLKYGTPEEEFDHYRRHSSDTKILTDDSKEENAKLAIWSVSARQEGFEVEKAYRSKRYAYRFK